MQSDYLSFRVRCSTVGRFRNVRDTVSYVDDDVDDGDVDDGRDDEDGADHDNDHGDGEYDGR